MKYQEMLTNLYKTLYADLVSLASVVGITENNLQRYFVPEGNAGSPSILFRLCSSLQNSGRTRNSIKFNTDSSNRNVIKKVLFDNDTKKSAATYQDWESIYEAIKAAKNRKKDCKNVAFFRCFSHENFR